MNKIGLVCGDPGGDGHSIKETYWIESNLSESEMIKAYKKGAKKLGTDLVEHICEDYQDRTVPGEFLVQLVESGAITEEDLRELEGVKDEPEWSLGDDLEIWGEDDFALLYLAVVGLGNNAHLWAPVKHEDFPTIEIGGYGLYE